MRYYDVTVMLVDTFDDLIRSLKAETVDAVVYDAPALMYIAKNDSTIKVVGEMFDEQKYGVAFPQGTQNRYKEIFNIAILEMQQSGEYQKIYNKWFWPATFHPQRMKYRDNPWVEENDRI